MQKLDFNSNWTYNGDRITLPHDAMILEKRSSSNPGGSANAYFPGGVYIYEKVFTTPADWSGKRIVFEFEGVYKDSKVYLNGKEIGGRPYGYMGFFADATNVINMSGENTLKVVADNTNLPNSRWYTGGGIYRPVWVHVGNGLMPESVKITTLSVTPARIRVDVEHDNGSPEIEIAFNDEMVAAGVGSSIEFDIPDAKLWNDETPNLYTCRVKLGEDSIEEVFGIRTIKWSNKGLFINGKETFLRGGCVHHDNGILGARSYPEAEERRVCVMKQVGFNAIRSSHYPASKAMLTACDKLGMYVMDETWDMWYSKKSKYDYSKDFNEWYKSDLKSLANRDYNHPSVIMYSIGNEVSEPKDEQGIALAKEMTDILHELDTTRPVTAGINLMVVFMAKIGQPIYKEDGGLSQEAAPIMDSTRFNEMASQVGSNMSQAANRPAVDAMLSPCLDILDIAGYNYATGRYPIDSVLHPERVIVGSETFPFDISKNRAMVKKYPYLIGDFMWTAWDYLGEAGLGAWAYTPDGAAFDKPYPWILADTGAIDILGNIGAQAEYAAVVWGQRKTPYIGVQPVNRPGIEPAKAAWRGTNSISSWAWQGCEGNAAVVEVYSDGAEAELILGGNIIDRKPLVEFKVTFDTVYKPETLTAIVFDTVGKELYRSCLVPASSNLMITTKAESYGEIIYLDISIADENGVVESNADKTLTVTVENGELLAFGSANPRTEENYNSGIFTTYYGKAQAIVRGRFASVKVREVQVNEKITNNRRHCRCRCGGYSRVAERKKVIHMD